jgi:hypothetical protein
MLFTHSSYRRLIGLIAENGYSICGIEDVFVARVQKRVLPDKYVAIRHDVDYFPQRALALAGIEAELKIATTYYVRRRFFDRDPESVRKITALGHQVGYHYEEVDTHQKAPNMQVARDAVGFFVGSLLDLDKIGFSIRTVCPHGNPLTDVDNRQVVHLLRDEKYLDMLAFTYDRAVVKAKVSDRLIGDASIDISGADFDLYIPDTGRFNPKYNLKDRIDDCPISGLGSLSDFERILKDKASRRIYMNMHPDRWSGDGATWLFDFCFDTAKNMVKRFMGKSGYSGQLVGEKAKKHQRAVLKSIGEKPDDGQSSGS